MKEIKIGFTNKKFKDGNKFIVKKNKNKFNHNIDYSILSEFDFVPKLLKDDEEETIWEWIDGEMLKEPTNDDLKILAKYIRQIHKSDLKFPKNNLRQRYNQYIKVAHNKGLKDNDIEHNWFEMNKLVTRMSRINPCHNDLWWQNIIKDKNGKIWIVDWEYSTMGDKHFDLSFFIESNKLTKEQEEFFLNEYNSYDDYEAYIPEWLPKYKKFCHWLTLCWANAQEKKPFPLTWIRNFIRKY